jgi:hypothetical protein
VDTARTILLAPIAQSRDNRHSIAELRERFQYLRDLEVASLTRGRPRIDLGPLTGECAMWKVEKTHARSGLHGCVCECDTGWDHRVEKR